MIIFLVKTTRHGTMKPIFVRSSYTLKVKCTIHISISTVGEGFLFLLVEFVTEKRNTFLGWSQVGEC